ncbi:MAG TPA: bifunctional diguanylate cyclase/phosphodiesterase, partial [Holophaga sp.]|nr:bifunctional diguanylate cyclase/phosphodiesterase [Holophaga sp.]
LETARRLGAIIRSDDTVARQHGDEFVIILNDVGETREEAIRECSVIGRRILESVGRAFRLDDVDYLTTMSIGGCLFHGGQPSPGELFQNADTAMHEAKAVGRNTLRFFDPAMKVSLESRVSLEASMRAGFPGQFLLHYQPQIDQAGHILGAEALVRWLHPVRGLVPPNQFIPVAEEIGLILDLGAWVLRTACDRLARLRTSPRNQSLHLSVNVSAMQFAQPDFVDTVLASLEASGADPHALELELTESMLVFNVDDVISKMSRLKDLGVTFSLDDFGTGYSSLSSLKRLPLDQLKIDQSFVRDILTDPNDAAIARTIIALGRSLGLAVIAEGVETQEQRDFLATQGCNLYQGYFFSRPLPPDQFEAFLDRTTRA